MRIYLYKVAIFLGQSVRIRSGFRYRINSGDPQHCSKAYRTLFSHSACSIILKTYFSNLIVRERAQDYHYLALLVYELMSLVHNNKHLNLKIRAVAGFYSKFFWCLGKNNSFIFLPVKCKPQSAWSRYPPVLDLPFLVYCLSRQQALCK